MDTRLFEAAQSGNIAYLQQLLRENPLILSNTMFSVDNPLYLAADMGHVDFVKEIIRLKPAFAADVNQESFSPMHIAAANGHVEIVRELMKVDSKLCRLEGGQKMTPFHYAALRGRAEVVSAMLLGCPDCIEDENFQRETALHLAVENNRFEATKILVDWIREQNKEDMLNKKDEQGNTVLHLATLKKQRQVIQMLFACRTPGSLEVNAINYSGLTALDMLLVLPSKAGDREIVEILQNAGAMRARDITLSTIPNNQTSTDNTRTQESYWTRKKLLEYFKFKRGRDSPGEARGTLLVIAVLVATATFQAGVNLPGGFWQDTNVPDQNNSITRSNQAHFAGTSIFATNNKVGFMIFVVFNSVGFSMALYMIYVLTSLFPLQFELQICLAALLWTYGTAISNITPQNIYLPILLISSITFSAMSIIAVLARLLGKKLITFARDWTRRVV